MADWAGLNNNLLISIAERLPSMESYDSFGGVCKSWQQAATEGHVNQTIFEGPWLMFAEKDDQQEPREFSSVSLGINRTRKIFLPGASKQRCVSCKDWLVISSPDDIEASLLHPLSGYHIHLPKFTTLSIYDKTTWSHFIEKAVITANPSTNSDYIVIIICGRTAGLGFWKSGDTSWTSMDRVCAFDDVIYSYNNKKVYALDEFGRIYSYDIHGPNPTQLLKVFDKIPPCGKVRDKAYLVELSRGIFLVVHKFLDSDRGTNFTTGFSIFEVNIENGSLRRVNDLGNKALFLGYNTSYSIECSEFNKCKPNCIYFTDDYSDGYLCEDIDGVCGGGKDMGIYHVSDGSTRRLFHDKIGRSIITPPTWIGPSF